MKRRYSLKRNKEFRHVYKTGKSEACKYLVLIYRKRSAGVLPRIGFSVSKKIGNSVVRNRVKRRLREAFSPIIPSLAPCNIIFVARAPIVDAEFSKIEGSVRYLLEKAELIVHEGDSA